MILSGFPLIFCLFCSVSDGKSCFSIRKSISTSDGMRSTRLLVERHNTNQAVMNISKVLLESHHWPSHTLDLHTSFNIYAIDGNMVGRIGKTCSEYCIPNQLSVEVICLEFKMAHNKRVKTPVVWEIKSPPIKTEYVL